MLCPICKTPAIIVEYNEIELDYCTSCRGVWFDAGELELLLASAGLSDSEGFLESMMNSASVNTKEKKRHCPICNVKMKKAHADPQGNVLVDICGEGHGIWFDGGEVEHVLSSLARELPEQNAALQSLIDHFGKTFKTNTSDNS